MVEKQRVEIMQAGQQVVLYIITGIPEDTDFMPLARKEISQIQWHWIDDLPCSGKADRGYGSSNQGSKAPNDKEHRYYLIKPFIRRIKAWVAKHPDKVGMPAVVVNPDGQPPLVYPTNTDVSSSRPGSVVTHTDGANVMSVQELFNVVGKKQGSQGTDGNSLSSSLTKQSTVVASFYANDRTVSLLQTLMSANTEANNDKNSDGESTTGQLTLSGFAFDTQRIMNAYRSSGV
ncbi:mRNA-decapping enzyme subunit 2 [Coemansia sp. RSA 1933]|nr:mRNA-decapping enzyme subunit 2 [Coemansia sp. RSA 1933]